MGNFVWSDERWESMSSRTTVVVVVLAVLVGLAVRLRFYGGLASIDDFNYLRHAAEVWQGRFDLASVSYWHGMRPLLFVPISWAFAAFGVSETTATLWPLLASLATIAIVGVIGARVGGRDVGAIAACLAALFPMAVEESTRVLPGALINLLVASSAAFFVWGVERVRSRPLSLAISGVLLAAMPWVGHLGLVFAVFFPLAFLIWRRSPATSLWAFVAGLVAMGVVTVLTQFVIAGDPFASVSVARKVLTSENATPRPLFYLSLLTYPFRSHGGVMYLAALGVAFAVVTRHRGAALVSAWLVAVYAILEFGSSSFVDYRPLFKQARYLSAVFVPGVVCAAFGTRWLLGRSVSRWVPTAAVLATGLVVGSWITLERNTAWRNGERHRLHQIRDHVVEAASTGDTIYVTHWLWNTRAAFYLGYAPEYATSGYAPYTAVNEDRVAPTSKIRYVQGLEPGDLMDDGILLNDIGIYRLTIDERKVSLVDVGDIPPLMAATPAAWSPIDTVRVNRLSHMVVLDIPEGAVWPGPHADDPW